MGWGDEYEDKSRQENKINYGRIFSFKTMSYAVNKIKDETKEYDEKHPKDDLMFRMILVALYLETVDFWHTFVTSVLPFDNSPDHPSNQNVPNNIFFLF